MRYFLGVNSFRATAAGTALFIGLAAPIRREPSIVSEQSTMRELVQGCARLWCEQEVLLTLAVEAIATRAPECRDTVPRVLSTLHLAPRRMGGVSNINDLVPTSPVVLRLTDIGLGTFVRAHPQPEVVDPASVIAGRLPEMACLLTLSPPQYRGENLAVVELSVARLRPFSSRQAFVVIHRSTGNWTVSRVEDGITQ
jgi:hypothetical protein